VPELRLGVVQVVDVDLGDAEIAQAPPELILEIARRDGMPAGDEVFGFEDARLHVHVAHVLGGIDRNRPVEREVAALRAEDELIAARHVLALERHQHLTDQPLAALGAVVDRGVEQVAAEMEGVDDRLAIACVGGVVLVAQVGAEADRRDRQAVERPEVGRWQSRSVSRYAAVSPGVAPALIPRPPAGAARGA
jgi:hypothetical protein